MDRVRSLRDSFQSQTQVGIHAHHNLSLSVAISTAAADAGAYRVDASLAGRGAGVGNTPLEVFVAVADLQGIEQGLDLFPLMDAADDIVRPLQYRPVRMDRETLSIGCAGVFSSYLRHADKAASDLDVDTRDILTELCRRKMIGGQEDMVVDVILDMKKKLQEGQTL